MADSIGAFERVIQQAIFPGRSDSGEPWCSPETARTIAAVLASRGPRMNGLIRQAVRLKRLIASADGVRGERFLYVGVRRLNGSTFARLIRDAYDRGALDGIVEVQDDGVVFTEPAMFSGTKAFDLGYRQMPAAAALLDICANAVGYAAVEGICEPITGRSCLSDAEQVSKALTTVLRHWLDGKLEGEYFARQERAIAQFLKARGTVNADAISDESILDFWRWMTGEAGLHPESPPSVDGFRGYRAAASRMLVYRAALEDRALELRLEGAKRFGEFERPDAIAESEIGALPGLSEGVVSPLAMLMTPPADAVKWFRNKDDLSLVGDLVPAGRLDPETEPDESEALFVHREPDPRLFRTFLRYATFGRVQTSFSQAARTGRPAKHVAYEAIYRDFQERLEAIEQTLDAVEAATAHVLLAKGRAEGLLIARDFDPTLVRTIIDGPIGVRLGAGLGRGDPSAISELAQAVAASGSTFAKKAQGAYASIERAGFRQRDIEDSTMTEALAAGAEALGDLKRIVAKVRAWLVNRNLDTMTSTDRTIFDARFQALFAAPAHMTLP